jgi:ATP-dependent metalloprotease FtsH
MKRMNHKSRLLVILLLISTILSLVIAFSGKATVEVLVIFLLVLVLFFTIYQNFEKILESFQKDRFEKKEPKPKQTQKNDNTPTNITAVKSDIYFKDVIGMEDVKDELNEIIDYIKSPAKYKKFNIKLPKGILLVGPPGVGKTMIAQAMANECGVPFFYESGSSFAQIYVGSGPKKVKELFNSAKKQTPAIIFIDEIDSIGKSRGANLNDERINTLNELLTQMDGFSSSSGVIVIGATNKIEVLDDALLRAGRFDKRVFLSLPTLSHREKILENILSKVSHSVNIEKIAKLTSGFNSAALSTLTNEAGLLALKNSSDLIDTEDFENVIDKVFIGKKTKLSLSSQDKEIMATYQISKALIAYHKQISFDKIDLINFNIKYIDSQIESYNSLLDKIQILLAGSAGLSIIYKDSFNIASSDIKSAITLSKRVLQEYFMSDSFITDDKHIDSLLKEQSQLSKEFLIRYRSLILDLSKVLLDEEVISFDKFVSFVNKNGENI